ncbi:MAG: 2-C-methyl-D-erythritol 4-phosphate cytidylyltransferase [Bacteroidales bacterium]|nr:2-C-methyl-D-erythritol 4-phosphate cytidylyltransferase [Bacteroidales bacterium]MCM1148361.1 2-C-methyl-D-erythritol 4-phosphate cytidylyltransferase [Bacteroidales bacterium]MCM1207034.1 2-C-methyl-D-erythritol 4-phosphate cytidylyltransferase [Bacillota bacterium]MCM1511305.1 2-C-methyl-D-erythritol 4-phosphate cytidylyltransferase [Clostridium sp.]
MNIAVILAGGSGTRVGGDMPKQFLRVAGKMIIEHTIEAFHRNPRIDEIAIVSRKDYLEEVREMVAHNGYSKVRHVLCGGRERYHSSLAAISACRDDNDRLLLHDCVRPLVSQRIIDDCLDALDTYEAVDVAVPTTDTIIEIDSGGNIRRIPQRTMLRNVQTPQGFRCGTIRRAFELAVQDPDFMPTDDCSVVFRYLPGTPIFVVEGDPMNIKVTYREDLKTVEEQLSGRTGPES